MNIITKGDAHWPFSVENYCTSCGTVYKIEKGDEYVRRGEQMNTDRIMSKCPVCHLTVTTPNPNLYRKVEPAARSRAGDCHS